MIKCTNQGPRTNIYGLISQKCYMVAKGDNCNGLMCGSKRNSVLQNVII